MSWDPTLDANDLAARIDHTCLRPDATEEEIRAVVAQARAFGVAGCCLAPSWVALAAEGLAGTAVKVVTVVGFPLGFALRQTKAAETREAVQLGADEVDAVLHLGLLKSGRLDGVRQDLQAVVQAAEGRPVKAILETGLLTDDQIRQAVQAAEQAGAAFVKTSTGFGPAGATPRIVTLLRGLVAHRLGVKASGGIRTLEQARALLAAGADRLGTSSTAGILAAARG